MAVHVRPRPSPLRPSRSSPFLSPGVSSFAPAPSLSPALSTSPRRSFPSHLPLHFQCCLNTKHGPSPSPPRFVCSFRHSSLDPARLMHSLASSTTATYATEAASGVSAAAPAPSDQRRRQTGHQLFCGTPAASLACDIRLAPTWQPPVRRLRAAIQR